MALRFAAMLRGWFTMMPLQKPELPAWKLISRRELLRHTRAHVVEDTVELPDGQRIDWLHYPTQFGGVTVIARDAQRRVLVSFQYSYPNARTVEEFPGGAIDGGETPEQAGARELEEETGWHARQVQRLGAYLFNNRRSPGKMQVVLATGLELREAQPETGEIISTLWLTEHELESGIASGEFENSNLLSAWAIYKACNK